MARALAIETSGRIGSIALVRDRGEVLVEEQFPHGLQHAALIIPIIDRLTCAQGWTPRDIEELYVSAGPGSFTGLRIGITLAKTMALATGVKVIAVPSVRVLAENAPADARHLIIVLDAKRDQIFTARFERVGISPSPGIPRIAPSPGTPGEGWGEGLSERWLEREPAHLDTLAAMLARSPQPIHLLGEGLPYHEQFIPADDPQIIRTPPELWRARAAAVAKIGGAMARAGEFADPDRLTPIYVRKPEAEEKFEAKQQGGSSLA